jgi:cytochrome c-type biogenesis protein CcmE
MKPQARKAVLAVVALGVTGSALAFLALCSLEDNLVYYWTPGDLLAKQDQVRDAVIRLGGMVQKDSVKWDAEAMTLRFVMSERPEPGGASVVVVSRGAPPQMFRDGIGCIVEGRFDGTVFHTERLMVKHSNEYRPPAMGEDPRKKYETLVVDPPTSAIGREATP